MLHYLDRVKQKVNQIIEIQAEYWLIECVTHVTAYLKIKNIISICKYAINDKTDITAMELQNILFKSHKDITQNFNPTNKTFNFYKTLTLKNQYYF